MSLFHYNTRSRSRSVGLELSTVTTSGRRNASKMKSKDIVIFEEPGALGKRPDMEYGVPPKRQRLNDITVLVANASNAATDNQFNTESVLKPCSAQVVKKIAMASEEADMNGAPAGDLYEVRVLNNEDFSPATSSEIADMLSAMKLPLTDNWAQQFDQLTSLRQLLLHHREMLTAEYEVLAARFIILGVESLRSTTVRNALLCMRQYIDTAATCTNQSTLVDIIHSLVKRCHSGPKFLMLAAEANIPVATSQIQAATIISACQELMDSKNMDISKRAYQMMCAVAPRVGPQNSHDFRLLITSISNGLNAKSSEVRNTCRHCMISIGKSLGKEANFKEFLSQFFSEAFTDTILKEITKAPVTEVKSSSLSKFRSKFGVSGNSTKLNNVLHNASNFNKECDLKNDDTVVYDEVV